MIFRKLNVPSIEIGLLILSFYEISFIPHMFFLAFKYSILIYLFAKYFKNLRKMINIIWFIFMYGSVVILSSIYNKMEFNQIVASVFYLLHIIDIFLICDINIRKGRKLELITVICSVMSIMILATDFLMLVINYDFADSGTQYLIGDKFAVSYIHCIVSALLFFKSTSREEIKLPYRLRNNLGNILFCLYSCMVCMRVACTTGIIMCVCLVLLVLLPGKMKEKMFRIEFVFGGVLIINLLILSSYNLLNIKFVSDMVRNIFGKSATWLGRLRIYEIILNVIKEHLWIGYGYFSNIIKIKIGFGNPQNGVLKILIDSGIFGLFFYFCIALTACIKRENKANWPIFAFLICMYIASFVEINITDYLMFLAMALLYSTSKNKNELKAVSTKKRGRIVVHK